MYFFSKCTDKDEVKTLYKRLALCIHPDKGGDTELMTELTRQRDEWDEHSSPNTRKPFLYPDSSRKINEFENEIRNLNIILNGKVTEIKNLKFTVETYCRSLEALELKNKELTILLQNAEELIEKIRDTLQLRKTRWTRFKEWLADD